MDYYFGEDNEGMCGDMYDYFLFFGVPDGDSCDESAYVYQQFTECCLMPEETDEGIAETLFDALTFDDDLQGLLSAMLATGIAERIQMGGVFTVSPTGLYINGKKWYS